MKRLLPLFLTLSVAPLAHAAPADAPAPAPATSPAPPAAAPADAAPAAVAKTDLGQDSIDFLAASSMLDESAKAYAALKGVSMQYTAHDDNKGKIMNAAGSISISRPGKARVEARIDKTNLLVVSDGKKIYSQVQPEQYQVDYAQTGDATDTVLGRVPSALGVILPVLAAGNNPLGLEGVKWTNVKPLPYNGVSFSTPIGGGGPLIVFSVYFDATDKLLRRVEAAITVKGVKTVNLTTITNVKIDPEFAPATFTFTPPPGAKALVQPPLFAPELTVGEAPIPLTGLDLAGKAHPWKDYSGKVVLLMFWTELSEPFKMELPNILLNYYNYHSEGLEVLGVALDSDKARVQQFIKANKMQFPSLFDGKSFRGADFTKYGLRAVPFVFLIGKDGKIAAINPHGRELEPAIVKALAS